jgi:hypothetical protein
MQEVDGEGNMERNLSARKADVMDTSSYVEWSKAADKAVEITPLTKLEVRLIRT